MSLYADYLRERTNDFIVEDDYGFATYRYLANGTQVYIIDIYVKPEYRKMHFATVMANEICKEAKARGCTEVIGTVSPSCKGANESILTLIAYGMKVHTIGENLIVFKKDI